MNTNLPNISVPLNTVKLGEKCRVNLLIANGGIRRRFLDLGLINGTEIKVLSKSPSGNLVAYLIRGAVIAIRSEDASNILVETI